MEKIIQMSYEEYEKLQEMASLNNRRINEKAHKLWIKKGAYEVSVHCFGERFFDCNYAKIKCDSKIFVGSSFRTPVSDMFRSRLENMLSTFLDNRIQKKYGNLIEAERKYVLAKKRLETYGYGLLFAALLGYALAMVAFFFR